ncbi:MAG TPA: formylglycine-generating enzyme family protein [Anaerolineales bacterium]|jgi:formylglycine-generating enzyme required for sulfatase activity
MGRIEFQAPALNERGEVVAQSSHSAELFTEDIGNGVSLDLIVIPAGAFQMGSPRRLGSKEEQPQHFVNLQSFMLGRTLITQAQWKSVLGKLPPVRFAGEQLPVERVTWTEARKFCERLSVRARRPYRLPSEAEWEYACRAGTSTPFAFGETLTTDYANFVGERVYRQEPPGLYRHCTTHGDDFPPNAFGVREMHGNLWEWCEDSWLDGYADAPRDGGSYIDRKSKYGVARGGSWHDPADNCRSAARLRVLQSEAEEFIGFRVACDLPPARA